MNFCWCTVNVKDMDESIRFYTDIVGLPVEKRYSAAEGVELAFLGDSQTKVELICNKHVKEVGAKEGISLGFEVVSVEEMMADVKRKGLEIDSGPFQPNPHIRFFYIKDPDGLKIQFVENM